MRRCLPAILLLVSITAFAVAPPTEVHVGLASNFSEISTGSSNPYGAYFKDGVALALKASEKKLKARKFSVVLHEFDYGTSDIKVLEATKKAIESNVLLVLGYNYSSNALLAAPLHQQAKLPMLTPSASATRLGSMGRYIHMGGVDNNFMGTVLARQALHHLKASKALLLPAANCAYCSDLADSFEKSFKAQGGSIVLKIPILLEDKDFSEVIAKIKNFNFDIVVIPNQELTAARMIAALSRAGVKVPFLGADGWGNVGEEFFTILKGIQFTGYSVSHWHPDVKSSLSDAFVRDYQKEFNKMPNDTSVLAYDSTLLLVDAILRAKSLTREGLEDALNSQTRFTGVTGKFLLNPNKAPFKNLVLLKSSSGKFKVMDNVAPNISGRTK